MKNFLLVVPRFADPGEFYNFPLGLAYISSYLKSKGFKVFCLNLCNFEKERTTENILAETITTNNINIVCTGGMSCNWDQIDEIVENVKKINPDIITVVGGAIIVSDTELALKNMKIDFGILGEGELTMAEIADYLCQNKDLKKIDGITYLDSVRDRVVINKNRDYIENLDELPFPDYEGFGFDKWTKLMKFSGNFDIADKYENLNYVQMLGSRSCPFSCTFCYHHLGQRYRERSIGNIFKEIDYLIEKYNVNFLYFLDELLSAKPERLMEFARRLKNYPIHGWAGSFRVNNIKLENLKILKESKLILMGYGIENVNDSILRSMNKRITREEVEGALKANHEAGLYCTGNIILGDPAETEETLKNSLNYWLKHPEYNLNLIFLMAIPDSKIFRYALEKNLIKDKLKHIKQGFPAINLTSLPDKVFYKFMSRVMWLKHKNQQMFYGELMEAKKIGSHKSRTKYSIKVKCPFCATVSEHMRLENPIPWSLSFICDKCTSPSKIDAIKIFTENKDKFRRRLTYASLFFQCYLLRFRFYRENKGVILKILIKIKSLLVSFYSHLKRLNKLFLKQSQDHA